MRYTLTAIALVLLLTGVSVWSGTKDKDTESLDTYTFSNTSSWNPALVVLKGRSLEYFQDWEDKVSIPPPPGNSSQETREELDKLLVLKASRSAENLERIEKELSLETMEIGGRTFTDYFDYSLYPNTSILFTRPFQDVTTITLIVKEKFDRVRPHVLEPDIEPAIAVPRHPAYPSGHSTQAHFMAYMLAEIFPEERDALLEEASHIGQSREIAGVHYESDTQAGQLLAEQLTELLLEDPEVAKLIEISREELKTSM